MMGDGERISFHAAGRRPANQAQEYDFKLSVGADGALKLAK